MIPSWARKGAKVVCVDDKSIDGGPFHLTRGRIYVILSVNDEWIRVSDDRRHVGGWHYSHFRPLVTKTQEQDVALFAPILHQNGAPVKELERT